MKRAGSPIAVASAVATLVSGCGSAGGTRTSVPAAYGTIQGTVTAGPTCPVEQAGHPCPPRLVSGSVSARRADGTTLTATINTSGTYRIIVPTGSYTLNVQTGSFWPRCPPTKVAVATGTTMQANISCDTGIR